MRLGVLSDVHGNVQALEFAIDMLSSRVEGWLFAGDAFSDHLFSNEVTEVLRRCDAQYVLGNHELSLLGPAGSRARDAPHVQAKNLAYVAERPLEVRLESGGRNLLMVHGSSIDGYRRYLAPGPDPFRRLHETGADFIVVGHTHLPLVECRGATLIVNPGSLGQPRRPEAPSLATCAILDMVEQSAELVEFPIPVAAEAKASEPIREERSLRAGRPVLPSSAKAPHLEPG